MKCLPLSLVLAVLAPSLAAADGTRGLDAHEHGVGQLDIAVDGASVVMVLAAPGSDIVGFEYAAVDDDDRAAVEAALAALARPLELFALPPAAGCEVVSADATLLGGEDGPDHDHDHDHDHGHSDDGAGSRHTEFRAEYSLTCADAAAIDRIEFPYFDRFPGARELEVQVVTGSGARAFEVTRDRPALDLGGTI